MKVAVTGSTGFVGTALTAALTERGDEIVRLVRRVARSANEVEWYPSRGIAAPAQLEGVDAVVHLAGESIGDRRWSPAQKERIRASRVEGTQNLVAGLAGLAQKPRVLVSVSAIHYYGLTGEREVDETSPPGEGFLPEVCRGWEDACKPLDALGVRVVHPRCGVILSPRGGALARMLTPFKLGVGGVVGNGRQWMSWIALPDAVGVLLHALDQDALRGAVNAVAPEPCTNAEFTRALGHALHRPTVLPLPGFAARLAFGELAEQLLLGSLRVRSKVLPATGYRYALPDLEGALRVLVGAPQARAG